MTVYPFALDSSHRLCLCLFREHDVSAVGTFMGSGPGDVASEDSPYPVFWFAAMAV